MTINYPLQQKHVLRVKPSITLSELFQLAVEQKNLDPSRYELRHPTSPDVVLDLSVPLKQYGIAEVTVVAKKWSPGWSSASYVWSKNCKLLSFVT